MAKKSEDVKLTSLVKTSGCAAKLAPKDLHSVIDKLPIFATENLIEGFESADDALVYRLEGESVMIMTVDFFPPMVDDPYLFGQIAAANALSDIYAMGAEPKVALNLLCFPSCIPLSVMEKILLGGLDKAKEAGCVIAGGHTISDPTPKYGLSVTGFSKEKDIWSNKGARVGDFIVLTKPLGVGIINTAAKGGEASEDSVKEAEDSMKRLNKEARDKAIKYSIHAATDVTGFSLSGHLNEICVASSVSVEIDSAALPIITNALEYARFGLLPEGMYNNLDYVSPFVDFGSLNQELRDLVCDPETSGGLLLFMREEDAICFTRDMDKPYVKIIGRVIEKKEKNVIYK